MTEIDRSFWVFKGSTVGAQQVLELVSEHFQSDLETLKERGTRKNLARRDYFEQKVAELYCSVRADSRQQFVVFY